MPRIIEIADDGVGIDIETVRAKAMERGMLKPDANLSDDEVLDFILAPGFSTAKSLTQISGRGVGLDVVNNEVKALGGSIGIYSSPGKGTRFVLRVPFTVSVNRALMVTVGDDQYAIPLNTIEGIVLVDNSELQAIFSSENKLFEYAGLAYRVRYLGRYLGRDLSNVTGRGGVPLVLVRSGELSMAVAVDGVQGSREIVVKSLGPQFAGVGGISGATILGDGRVVVILDLLALIRSQGRDALGAATRDVANHVHTRCVMVVDDSVTVRKVTTRAYPRHHAARHRDAPNGWLRGRPTDAARPKNRSNTDHHDQFTHRHQTQRTRALIRHRSLSWQAVPGKRTAGRD